jgi:hypothetical protein
MDQTALTAKTPFRDLSALRSAAKWPSGRVTGGSPPVAIDDRPRSGEERI